MIAASRSFRPQRALHESAIWSRRRRKGTVMAGIVYNCTPKLKRTPLLDQADMLGSSVAPTALQDAWLPYNAHCVLMLAECACLQMEADSALLQGASMRRF
jgi:hypothetical protein